MATVPLRTATSPLPRRTSRGRLFRKYLLLILSLVTIALLASGAISIYFTYQETKASLALLQHEKALAAASRIEQYIAGIERQLAYAALPQLDASDVELRRIEFLKLLRQAPEITDICQLDPTGREQICVSRLGMDSIAAPGQGKDRSQEPAFRNAKRSQPWFSPVYFRKETEPYMTIALRSGGDSGPVIVADVNLKFIWDVVSRIKIGEKGKAYVVDGSGFLVADPDIGLVLRKTDLSELAHVKAALGSGKDDDQTLVSTDLAGTQVLASVAPIESLHWYVFVEQPVAEVYAKLNASIVRTGLLLLAGLVLSALGALALARGMVRPIRTLEEGAERIGSGDLDQKIEVHTGDELEALANRFNRMTTQLKESYAGLERKVEERTQELQNSLEQQTAISEILRVISSSPTDVQPVLDAVAERAAHLCNAQISGVLAVDGDMLRRKALYSRSGESVVEVKPVLLRRTSITGRAILDRETIHYADAEPLIDSEFPDARENQQALRFRAVLAVPLVREAGPYGGIFLYRREPVAFSADEIALVQTFARQAAIAIDNVRLFNETKEALDQQTAISEILRVISSSPGDVTPMLNAVAERAMKLCDAAQSTIVLVDGSVLRCAASVGSTGHMQEGEEIPLSRGSVAGRAVVDGVPVQIEDLATAAEDEFPVGRDLQRRIGHHTALAVPLMREGRAIGSIQLWRMEKRAFSEKQISLVKTFADQAAIAIENVRLFNETNEALARQTATAEILRVISSSPTDVQPVFEAIVVTAARLLASDMAFVMRCNRDTISHVAAATSTGPMDVTQFEDIPIDPGANFPSRVVVEKKTLHLPDWSAIDLPEHERALRASVGINGGMLLPLVRGGECIGLLAFAKKRVGGFADKEIALAESFRDQALIAIENVRLFNETKEALERQTAIAEILRVISSSHTDVVPVLDAIAERAARLCDASAASMYLIEGNVLRHLASKGPSPDPVSHVDTLPINRDSITGRAVLERETIQVPDLLAEAAEYPLSRDIAKRFGHRTVVVVPLLREGRAFGAILLRRQEVRPFNEREIALLRTFGDQAAIAIENVRLFNETKEALEQQRASGEVLAAISSSIADTSPVFERILESCERLFEGTVIAIEILDPDGILRIAKFRGSGRPDQAQYVVGPVLPGASISANAILSRSIQHIPDLALDSTAPERSRMAYGEIDVRAVIVAPMLWEGTGIGCISVGRDRVGPFSDKEVALLKTFADQAVIAIQNARLFNETKEALEQQQASGEVLAAISSSIADTKPVFDRILASSERLFAGTVISVNVVGDDGLVRTVAHHGPGAEELLKQGHVPIDRQSATGVCILERRVLHFPDAQNDPAVPPVTREGVRIAGAKAAIFAPMLWEGKGIGSISVGRDYVGPFSEKEIALLKTFADQAVIAIQNARLFNETKEALDQQRASGEVLTAISSSIADTQPVFDVILQSCQRLFFGDIVGVMVLRDGNMLDIAAYAGQGIEHLRKLLPRPLSDETVSGRAILQRRVVACPDVGGHEVPALTRDLASIVGYRSIVAAPMIFEGNAIGALWVGRSFAGAFSEKQLALLKTFAEQAVIAIQNARLFREIREKSQQLEVANKHKSEFLANMSHELRTPLNAIIGFSEVLIERLFGDLNEKQADYLNDIHSSGKHLLTLINDILDLSKVEAGRMELEVSTFDLASAVSNAMTLVRERAQRHGIALGQQVDAKLDNITADERKFKQILLNLLSNAVKFTPDGGRIDVSAQREDGNAVISVHDTGIGIAHDDQATVFEEFRQVGRDYTKKQEGTGLGLTLTKKFVELHGGRIWLESEPGRGSTFTFTIPLQR